MTSKKMNEMTEQEHKEIMKSALDFITNDFKVSEERTEDLLKFAKGAMMFLVADLPISANGFIANTASEIIEELESRYDKVHTVNSPNFTIIHSKEVVDYLSMCDADLLNKARRTLYLGYLDDTNKRRIVEAVLGAYDRSAVHGDMFRINKVTVHSKITAHNKERAYVGDDGLFVLYVNDFATVMIGMNRVETVSII